MHQSVRRYSISYGILAILTVSPAAAAGLLEPGCRPNDVAGPGVAGLTCGGPVANPSGVYLFSGETFHTAVDMRIRGRGMDFVWARTYRSRVSPNVGLGAGWDHSYNIRLTTLAGGPSEALNLQFPVDNKTLVWDPPLTAAGDAAALRYCTLRSTDPSDFVSGTTVILDPDEPDTTTIDADVPAAGQLYSYLIRPKNGTREGSLGTDSTGNPRSGVSCGLTGPELVLHDGTGRHDTYRLQPGGVWTAPEFFRELVQNPDGSFTLTMPDTDTWHFRPFDGNPAEGKIREIVDRNGNTISFDYDALGRLTTITDTLGRDIVVGYDASGFIGTVTDFTGRQVRYEYHPLGGPGGSFDDLRSVTTPIVVGTPNGNDFPSGKTTLYTYSTGLSDPALNHNLLTITDPKGQQFLQNTYAPTTHPADLDYDRVISQIWGGPTDVLGYFYQQVTPAPANGFAELLTIENDRVGNVTELYYDGLNRNVLRREYTGRAPNAAAPTTDTANRPVGQLRPGDPAFYETRWIYNSESLAELTVLPNGSEIELIFDLSNPGRRSQGNPSSHCQTPGPLGGQQPRICETFEYDDGPTGTNSVTRHVDGRGNETLHIYDSSGNRRQTTHRISSIVEDFDYNGFGQMTSHTLPDNGSGHRRRDEFVYYTGGAQQGYRAEAIVDAGGLVLTTTYDYDARGNITRTVDPKGNDTQMIFNDLDQLVREISRAVAPGTPRYETDLFYDANDNVVRVDRINVDDSGVVSSNTHFTTIHEYDVLDNPARVCHEVQDYSGPIPGAPALPTCAGLPSGAFLVEEYEYDSNRNAVLARKGEAVNGTDPDNVVVMTYDERDLKFQEVRAPGSPDQSTTEYDYDLMGNLLRALQGTDLGAPHVYTFGYDGYDRLVVAEDPMGNVETFEYDANDNVVRDRLDGELQDQPGGTANQRLFEAETTYDGMDRIETRVVEHFDTTTQVPILDGQSVTQLIWSDSSQLLVHTDDRGNSTLFEYDSVNRKSSVADARGNHLFFDYDPNSNVVARISEEISDLGSPTQVFVTHYDHDGLDRLIAETDNVGNTRLVEYDSRGNTIVKFDSLSGSGGSGNRTRMTYDGVDRLLRSEYTMTSDGTGSGVPVATIKLLQEWDDSHRLVTRVDDSGNATRYGYDALDRLTSTTFEDGTSQTLAYDVHDAPVERRDANGTLTTISRDLNTRITGRNIVPAPGVQGTTFENFVHDGASRVVIAEDDDAVVETRYDSLNRVIEETQNGQTVGSQYDGVGNRLRLIYPGGRATDFTYDALNRLEQVLEGPAAIAEYLWIGPTRVEARNYANGTQLNYEYDGIANPPGDFGVKQVSRTVHAGSAGPIDDRIYAYDGMYNKTLAQDVAPGGPQLGTSYSYDSRYRMIASDRFDAAGPLGTIQYDLDGVTNRLAVAGGPDPGSYVLDGTIPNPADQQVNQYTRTPFDARVYDENGNLTLIDPGTPVQRDAVYDYANRMVQYFDPAGGLQVDYEYDPLGRRIARTVTDTAGSNTTRYYYDGWQVCEEQDATGVTQATYVYGNDVDEALTMRRFGNDFYYHGDEQFNVMAVTDMFGSIVERYQYEDYGEPTVFDAAGMPIPQSAILNPYLFGGRHYDDETGWYHHRTRYMDPRAGRFTTRDTLGLWGDASALGNGYTYAAGNPATHRDPYGEMIFVKIPHIPGDVKASRYQPNRFFLADSFSFGVEREMKESGEKHSRDYFVADSFSFGVEREMKESGEKGGTEDINIGVGELQECTISKSMDRASAKLAQFAINGNSCGTAEIDFVEVGGGGAGAAGKPVCYLKYKLDRCFVKSWSTSGDADDRPTEEVAFYYNKIAFAYAATVDGDDRPTEEVAFYYNKVGYHRTGNAGASNDRPTEEVAFYYNKIAFSHAPSPNGGSTDRPNEEVAFYYNKIGAPAADSFSFGVEREMKESGEKGGTEDINIGLGELQECTISKSMD